MRRRGASSTVLAEPGQAITASAAITVYTVGVVKELPGIHYVSVDGGMSDNPRPVLYGSGYETFLPRATDADRSRAVRVVSKHCESGATCWCGRTPFPTTWSWATGSPPRSAAPTATRWDPTTTSPRPPVLFVRDGDARVVVRRETYDDLLRLDC